MKVTPHYDKANNLTHFGIDGELYLADQAPRDLYNLAGNVCGRLHCVGKLSARGPTYFVEPLTRAAPSTEMRFPPGTVFADLVPLTLGDSDGTLVRMIDSHADEVRFPNSVPITLE